MKTDSRTARGRRGEALAAQYLERLGYRILLRNVHLRHAELDLVALEGRTLCIVEVRLRRSARFGTPEESIDSAKRRRIVSGARELVATRRLPAHERVRFDVVAVDASREPPDVRLLRGAFEVN